MSEKKEVSTQTQEDLLARFHQMQPRKTGGSRVNTIKLDNSFMKGEDKNPDFGKLFAISFDNAGEEKREEIDITTAEFFPAKVMVAPVCRDFDEEAGRPQYSCPETDIGTPIQVFDSNGELREEGEYKHLKEKYNLRYIVVLYVSYGKKVYKWYVKGGTTLGSWFNVQNHIFKQQMPYTFMVKELEKEKAGQTVYYAMHFKLGSEFPLKDAVETMEQLNEDLAANSLRKQGERKEQEAKQLEAEADKQPEPAEEQVDIPDLPWEDGGK